MNAVEALHLTKVYSSARKSQHITALSDFSLTVQRGEIFGLLGPNGAGKTTFIKLLLSICHATSGEAKVLGEPIGSVQIKSRIGYLPENHRYPLYLTGEQVLDYFGQLSGMEESARKKAIMELLDSVDMTKWKKVKIKKYSKGMLQRIGLAQAMINNPDLIFLDEPTDGVDPIARKEIRDLLVRKKEEGKTIFVNSHLLSEVEMISDRVAILNNGKLVKFGTVKELTETKQQFAITLSGDMPEALETEWRAKQIHFQKENHKLDMHVHSTQELNAIIDALRSHRCEIESIVPKKDSLEDLFIDIIKKENA